MSQAYLIKCKNCNYQQEMVIGLTRGETNSLERAIKNLNNSKQGEVKQILDKFQYQEARTQLSSNHSWKIYYCNSCHHIFNRFWMAFSISGEEIYNTQYLCPRCKSKEIEVIKDESDINKEIKTIICPKCKRNSLDAILSKIYD